MLRVRNLCSSCQWRSPILLAMGSLSRVYQAEQICSGVAATSCYLQIILGQALRIRTWHTLIIHRYSAFPYRISKQIPPLFSWDTGKDSRVSGPPLSSLSTAGKIGNDKRGEGACLATCHWGGLVVFRGRPQDSKCIYEEGTFHFR